MIDGIANLLMREQVVGPKTRFLARRVDDRHYVLDRASGRLSFGNGQQGMIPPLNETIMAKEFQSGGGAAGPGF